MGYPHKCLKEPGTETNWIKEFDKEFPKGEIGHKHNENCEWSCELRPRLKDFIRSLLLSEREKAQRELLEAIPDGMLLLNTKGVSKTSWFKKQLKSKFNLN